MQPTTSSLKELEKNSLLTDLAKVCFVLLLVLSQSCHMPVPVNLKTVSKMPDEG